MKGMDKTERPVKCHDNQLDGGSHDDEGVAKTALADDVQSQTLR